ncbi:MAG: HDIG domain-containing metalloprotein [Patescibacteria group bacterium]
MTNAEIAEEYLKKVFVDNPDYSFGDWSVIYQHSLNVRDLALKIAEQVECDKELLELFALFHDIGKAYKADYLYLHEHHEELGFNVAEPILSKLSLSTGQSVKLTEFLKGDLSSVEANIMKDADTLAFFMDERLQDLFKKWADEKGLVGELQRKADKYQKLKFEISKAMGKAAHDKMCQKFQLI